jgi:hypothetical protein
VKLLPLSVFVTPRFEVAPPLDVVPDPVLVSEWLAPVPAIKTVKPFRVTSLVLTPTTLLLNAVFAEFDEDAPVVLLAASNCPVNQLSDPLDTLRFTVLPVVPVALTKPDIAEPDPVFPLDVFPPVVVNPKVVPVIACVFELTGVNVSVPVELTLLVELNPVFWLTEEKSAKANPPLDKAKATMVAIVATFFWFNIFLINFCLFIFFICSSKLI